MFEKQNIVTCRCKQTCLVKDKQQKSISYVTALLTQQTNAADKPKLEMMVTYISANVHPLVSADGSRKLPTKNLHLQSMQRKLHQQSLPRSHSNMQSPSLHLPKRSHSSMLQSLHLLKRNHSNTQKSQHQKSQRDIRRTNTRLVRYVNKHNCVMLVCLASFEVLLT
jgi:hypothetical protein